MRFTIIDYCVAKSRSLDDLERLVLSYCKDGFVVQGRPFVFNCNYHQACVKYAPPPRFTPVRP